MKHDFRNAMPGDKVTCLLHGRGVIKNIRDYSKFKIEVKFEEGPVYHYTTNGKLDYKFRAILYHGHVDFLIQDIPLEESKVGLCKHILNKLALMILKNNLK